MKVTVYARKYDNEIEVETAKEFQRRAEELAREFMSDYGEITEFLYDFFSDNDDCTFFDLMTMEGAELTELRKKIFNSLVEGARDSLLDEWEEVEIPIDKTALTAELRKMPKEELAELFGLVLKNE